MTQSSQHESLSWLRAVMVLAAMSPIFIFWMFRGAKFLPDKYFIPVCVVLAIVPNLILWSRIRIAKKNRVVRSLVPVDFENHRDQVLTYLLAMLLPFYADALDSWRPFGATLIALIFIALLFYNLNLHYLNIFLVIRGYRIFTIHPAETSGMGRQDNFILITRRPNLKKGEPIVALRVSDTVFLESADDFSI